MLRKLDTIFHVLVNFLVTILMMVIYKIQIVIVVNLTSIFGVSLFNSSLIELK